MCAKNTRSYGEPVFAFLTGLLLYFFRFGYDYGHSDQGEFLPVLLHRLAPDVLAQDWYVQTQAGFTVRTPFTLFLEGPARLIGVEWAVFGVYVLAWGLLASAVYALARRLTHDRLAAVVSVIVALVLTPQWTLGGNDLVHRMLVPSMPGWGLGLWGVYAFLRGRYAVSGLLFGLATWMQPLVGLQLAMLCGLLLSLDVFSPRERASLWKRMMRFGGLFLLVATPMLAPLIYQQVWLPHPPPPPDTPSVSYILPAFRAPHHYLPDSFSADAVLRFGLLFGIGLMAFSIPHCRKCLRQSGFIARSIAIMTGTCFLAYYFSEIHPFLFITKLQLFKLTVFLKVLIIIVLSAAVSIWLPIRLWRWCSRMMASPWPVFLILGAWTYVGVSFFPGPSPVLSRWLPHEHSQTAMADLEKWASEHSGQEAIFVVPPSFSGFRTRARRAIVVDFKAVPFEDDQLYSWFSRLRDQAPISLPRRGGAPLIMELDEAYAAQPVAALERLAEKYQATHFVRPRPLPPTRAFVEVYRNDDWVVYRHVGRIGS